MDYSSDSKDPLPHVWKIFSQTPLTDDDLKSMFINYKDVKVADWLAYPHYNCQQNVKKESFVLAKNLFHINAIEWAASAMEMSVVGAKNVANLALSQWRMQNDVERFVQEMTKERKMKLEL